MSLVPTSPFGFFTQLDDSTIFLSETNQQTLAMHFYWPNGSTIGVITQSTNPTSWATVVISSTPIPEFANCSLIIAVAMSAVVVFTRTYRKKQT